MSEHRELIDRLRTTGSRSKRELLDEAARVIENLEMDLRALQIRVDELERMPVMEWRDAEVELPPADDYAYHLVIVSGKPTRNITLDRAVELAEYDPDEGWILEMWPEWEGAGVAHWMPLPEVCPDGG